MKLDELAIEYYHSALELAQKSLIAGLTVSGIAYLSAINGKHESPYLIPILEIETASFNYFSIALLTLFITCGALCAHGINKAIENWKSVADKEISIRLLQAPNILISGTIVHSLLYGFLFMVGASLSEIIFEVTGWKSLAVGSLISLPYYVALSFASRLKRMNRL